MLQETAFNKHSRMAYNLLFTDPEKGEELRLEKPPEMVDGYLELHMSNRDGTQKWIHKIKTTER